MGCGNTNTSGNEKDQEKETNTISKADDGTLIGMYSGLLIKGLNFQNCLIKSNDELINNLRMFIPTVISKDLSPNGFNLKDDFLTNSININYKQNYIIALKGFNNIETVITYNDNYLIFHDGITNTEDRYIALIVKRIEGEPQILFSPEIE